MGTETTTIIVAIITAIIGPIIVYYLTNRKLEHQKEINELLQLQGKSRDNLSDTSIKITSPREDEKVDDFFTVLGTYKNKPSNSRLQLFVIAPRGEPGYWPQGIATFTDDPQRNWRAQCHVGGKSGATATIIAALVGPDGQALCNYYKKVGDELQRWPSIDVLTSDIIEVDRINVRRK